jgi:Ca2+/H+ antiporter, TMEM165/GDT1 family
MKLRWRPSPLLLLLLPSISSIITAAATETSQSDLINNKEQRDGKPDVGVVLTKPTSKADVGTKDAPVDGKDGKPHAGPFVDTGDLKKPKHAPEDGELVTKKPGSSKDTPSETVMVDGVLTPEVNDGVMNDPSRKPPKQGTTGTEGGVSEKDKARKAQEGQTGEKVEKKPDSPKEAPPLPVSEQDQKDENDATVKKDKDASKKNKNKDPDSKVDDVSELAGLEVGFTPKKLP